MRIKYEEQLQLLNTELIEMGGLIEQLISDTTTALLEQNTLLADKVIEKENLTDKMEKEIESLCMNLLLQQQPVAGDLRVISSALKMITDMERIGDQARDIAEIAKYLSEKPYIKELVDIPQMAATTQKMLKESIDSFVNKDVNLAKEVIESDDIVDNLFVKVRQDLIALIHKDPNNGEQAMDLFTVAKYFERIGDHATNIAEWVVYMITGEHKSEDDDDDNDLRDDEDEYIIEIDDDYHDRDGHDD